MLAALSMMISAMVSLTVVPVLLETVKLTFIYGAEKHEKIIGIGFCICTRRIFLCAANA
jgi:hypothetical protein